MRVDDVLSDGSSTYTPGISSHASTGSRFEHQDYLGTNRFETDSSQKVQGGRTYDAFGNPTSTTGSPQGPFGFAGNWGYQEDPDTGLKLLGHRYYDPSTGRFLTRDPAKDGRNWYGYCGNRPDFLVDPLGLMPGWLSRTWGWFKDPEVPIFTKVAWIVPPILLLKAGAAGVSALYIAHVKGEERIKLDRLYDVAHDRGLLHDEDWYKLKKQNALSALKDAMNVWSSWWNILWDIK